MAATSSQLSVIRSLIPDTDRVFGANDDEYMFADSELQNFFTAGGGNVLRAAGFANYAIATSEVLISKKIRTQDLQTDGAAVANALIIKANALFTQADKMDAQGATDFFEIVEFNPDGYSLELAEYPFDDIGNQLPGTGYGRGGYGR